jgi:hypothetical protein
VREPHGRRWWMAVLAVAVLALVGVLSLSRSGDEYDGGTGAPGPAGGEPGDDGAAGGGPLTTSEPADRPPDTTDEPDVEEEPPDTTATTEPVGAPAAPASVEECERQAQEARARLAYEPRRSMVEDQTYTITAALGLDGAPDVTFTTSTTIVIIDDARCTVEAELTGADFDIDPPGGEQQSFVDTRQLVWEWSVRPRRSGDDLALHLRLQVVVVDDAHREVPGRVVLNVSDIDVDAAPRSLPDRASDWTAHFFDHPLVVVVGAPLATAGVVGLRRRWAERRTGRTAGGAGAGA